MRAHAAPSSVQTRAMNLPGPSPLVKSQSHGPSFSSGPTYSHPTAFASTSTLLDPAASVSSVASTVTNGPSPASHPPNGGPVMASDSIINQVADSSKSLYQICVKLKQRLSEVPGFDVHLEEMDYDDNAEGAVDPVESMWRCLRKGYPLMTVYNALKPEVPLEVDSNKVAEAKRAKTASFKFVQACLKDLNFPPDECFLIMDLYGDDTTGFVKVTTVVNRVLDILQQRHLLLRPEVVDSISSTEQTHKRTRKDFVVGELVDTERKYVQDLETLQQFKKLVEEKGEVAGDTIHAIFLNLNALLDFQRRFLIRIETMNSLPSSQQNWGQLFTQYHDAFRVYEPYIANQQNADEQAMREFDKLQKVGHRITNDRATLSGFLMKPFQRLSKYPLLLKELRDKCDEEEALKLDLTTGIESAASVLKQANTAIDKQQRQLAVDELRSRVEEWKGHDIQQFGELLLYGTFTVVKGDGRNDVEREVGDTISKPSRYARAKARLGSFPFVADSANSEPKSDSSVSAPNRLASHRKQSGSASESSTPGSSRKSSRQYSFDTLSPSTPASSQAPLSALTRLESWDDAILRAWTSPSPHMEQANEDYFYPNYHAIARSKEEELRSLEDQTRPRKKSLRHILAGLTPINTQPVPASSKTVPSTPASAKHIAFLPGMPGQLGSCSSQLYSPTGMDQDLGISRTVPPTPTASRSTEVVPESRGRPRHSSSYGRGSRDGIMHRQRLQGLPKRHGLRSKVGSPAGMLTTFNSIMDGKERNRNRSSVSPLNSKDVYLEQFGCDLAGNSNLEKKYANENGVLSPCFDQYKIYLFERILLCCKEQNPNKQKNKVMSMNKPAVDKKGKPRLQLKGRIFMQNVTETLSLQKPGSYTIQIFWKGDPGVENFVIRFTNEEMMKRWYNQVEEQRKFYTDASKASGARLGGGTSDTEFAWVKNQGVPMQNPYQQDDEIDDDDDGFHDNLPYGSNSEFEMSRNASNTSLRSRSTTGDSGPPPTMQNGNRVPPPRFPMGIGQQPPLTLHTQLPNAPSPGEQGAASYFSPAVESPISSRVSSSSSIYPFPRQTTPNNGWPEEHNRFTAPAMGRNIMRPSLPAMTPQSMQQPTVTQNRSRSASSPDIHNRLNLAHRPNGQGQPPVPDVPMPPFPAHMAYMKHPVNRSQNSSPTNPATGLPARATTQSPAVQRDRVPQHRYTQPHSHEHDRNDQRTMIPSRNTTPVPVSAVDNRSQAAVTQGSSSGNENVPTPTQLKVKVSFDSNYVTLVVGTNISYQSLVDRIDAKLSRFTSSSIGRGTIKLRYEDEDGDFVTVRSDEGIQIAFSEWKEQQRSQLLQGQLGEIQMYCHNVD